MFYTEQDFYPRPPRGGRPGNSLNLKGAYYISTHALREEGDAVIPKFAEPIISHFYPRPPRGGRPAIWRPSSTPFRFLPTPSARRATQGTLGKAVEGIISTHALREEGDVVASSIWVHTPLFLPTPSARRATYSRSLLRTVPI